MRRAVVLTLAYAMGVLAFIAPIVVSLVLSDKQSQSALEDHAVSIAAEVLRSNITISDQVVNAIRQLEDSKAANPCSDDSIALMRQLTLASSRLHVIGHISGNELRCSSLGRHGHGLQVGPPDFLSVFGYYVRRDVRLSMSPGSSFRVSASAKSGYAAFAHIDMAYTMALDNPDTAIGLVGITSKRLLFQNGLWKPEWLERLGPDLQAVWDDGDYIVAMQRSMAYNYASYAAIPVKIMAQGRQQRLLWMLPVGIVAGLILAFSIYFTTMQQINLPAQLRHGMKKGELFLVYQPIVELATGRWVGAEALLRWQQRDGSMVSPDLFIPMAERRGMMTELTAYMLRTFARDAAALLRERPDFFINLNFSPTDLQDPALARQLAHTVQSMGIRPANLHVEATERVFMNVQMAQLSLRALREQGFHIAIDDFGTGYSSLSYLTTLDVDCLKIDKNFVSSIGTGSATSQVVSHIIDMARSLRLTMIAEGVETQAQADYLRTHDVQCAQGWLYARPMLIGALAERLAETAPVAPVRRAQKP